MFNTLEPSHSLATLHHNKLKDFTTTAFSEVCHNYGHRTSITLNHSLVHCATANVEDEACLDIIYFN